MERANRFAVALVLGLAGGTAASLGFAFGVGAAASLVAVGLISSPIVIAAIPLLTGLAVGYGFAAEISNPLKETWFEQKPEWFGTSP